MANKNNKQQKQQTRKHQKQSKRQQIRNKSRRKSIRKIRGGSFSMKIGSVIPYNNYLGGDVQREIVSTRILP